VPYRNVEDKRACQRRVVAERRAAFFAGKCCEWCGSTDELQLHHRDRSAKTSHKIWSWSERRRAAEIAKCIVLCRACHERSHAETRRIEAELRNPHGTYARYKLGCSCALCRLANTEYQRARKVAA
jgi:hypothetical protein